MTTFVDATTIDGTNESSAVVKIPTGVQSGDVILAAINYYSSSNYPMQTPSGWTEVSHAGGGNRYQYVFSKTSTGSDGGTNVTFLLQPSSTVQAYSTAAVAYRGVLLPSDAALSSATNANTVTAPSVTTTVDGDLLVLCYGVAAATTLSVPSGTTSRAVHENDTFSNISVRVVEATQAKAGATATYTSTLGTSGYAKATTVALKLANRPPNAPAWVTPQNSAIPADQDAYLEIAFSDPDPGDSMSASNWKRWTLDANGNRVAGSEVDTYQPTPSTKLLISAGTLTAGTKYEFQADTLDSQGAEGPYSASLFVTAQTSPGAPTITDPTSGATIGTSSYTFVISTPSLQESEWTLYADDGAGGIDTSTILQGPVSVTTGDLRSHTFTGLANNVPVWASVRIKDGGLWSQPRQQRNPVSYTPPAAPVITLTPDAANGSLVVGITNPAGGTATSYNNVYVDDGKGAGKERVATMLPTNTPWTYPWPVSLRDYTGNLWVEAVGVNGTTAETAA